MPAMTLGDLRAETQGLPDCTPVRLVLRQGYTSAEYVLDCAEVPPVPTEEDSETGQVRVMLDDNSARSWDQRTPYVQTVYLHLGLQLGYAPAHARGAD